MAITVINENDYIRDSREVINNNFNELDTLKAPLNSPALTGTPTAPTPLGGDNSTKIATTAYVKGEAANYLPLSGGSVTGNLSVSGTITGNVTGNVTGNADTATNATNDANGNPITGTYLPLAGGTLTGDVSASADLSVAGDTSLTNLSVSGTTALAGTSTAPTPSADDNSTKIATTGYVQTEIKPIEADVSVNDKRISNIEKLLEGNLYDYQTDTDSKYTKTVLSGAMPYASLEQIGGRTVVWNQLMQNGNFADTSGWSGLNGTISASDNVLSYTIGATIGDNTYTNLVKHSMSVTLNHKYFLSMDVNLAHNVDALNFWVIGGGNQNISLGAVAGGSWKTLQAIFTKSGTGNGTEIQILSRNAFSAGYTQGDIDKARNVMLTDLTSLYGAGNEPSTVSEFQQTFPAVWYAYNPGSLLSAGVTEVVSKKADTTTLETYPIPAEVQALEGYGWSVQLYINNVYSGDVYNQIDFENKKYIQNVGKVTLNGSESWTWDTNNALAYTTIPNGFIVNAATQHNTYVMSSNPSITSTSWGRRSLSTYTMGMYYGQTRLYCKSSNFTSANDVKTYFTNNPTDVNYVLQNPVETDISAYLTDDNLIEVEAGGTLTFENQHGDDYRINVPSSETYMVDLQSAI